MFQRFHVTKKLHFTMKPHQFLLLFLSFTVFAGVRASSDVCESTHNYLYVAYHEEPLSTPNMCSLHLKCFATETSNPESLLPDTNPHYDGFHYLVDEWVHPNSSCGFQREYSCYDEHQPEKRQAIYVMNVNEKNPYNITGNMYDNVNITYVFTNIDLDSRNKKVAWKRYSRPISEVDHLGEMSETCNDKYHAIFSKSSTSLMIHNIDHRDAGDYYLFIDKICNIVKLEVEGVETTTNTFDETSTERKIRILFILVGCVILIGSIALISYATLKVRSCLKVSSANDDLSDLGTTNDRSFLSSTMRTNIQLLPYNYQYEIRKRNIKIGLKLGEGQFGVVYKAELFECLKLKTLPPCVKIGHQPSSEESITVAVKMVKDRSNHDHVKSMMSEIKVMDAIGTHLNIVNLIGACTKYINQGTIMMVVEYCQNGCLRDHLISRRSTFIDEYHKIEIARDNYISIESLQTELNKVSTSTLISFAYQVARGMEYLSSKDVVHRDLAARNILLTFDGIVKICDFGLAKECYNYNRYTQNTTGEVPLKWMAPESISDRVYTTKSDIWSYGILLWEIFSLGATPYPAMECDTQFLNKILLGHRMDRPKYCPRTIFDGTIMKCWDIEPDSRPDFTDAVRTIGNYFEINAQSLYETIEEKYV